MFYVVRALSPYTEYEFMVIAVNNIGRGPQSAPATCTTGETGNETLIGFCTVWRYFFNIFLFNFLFEFISKNFFYSPNTIRIDSVFSLAVKC